MTVGRRFARMNSKIRENSVPVSIGSLWTSKASLDDSSIAANATARSAQVVASTRRKEMPKLLAAASAPANRCRRLGVRFGLTKKAARDSDGAISCSNCNRFGSSSADIWVKPVVLPPGRPSEATRPCSTGSLTCINTIGIVCVAACSAAASRRPDARDDGRRERHQLTRQAGEPVGLAHRIERLDQNGLAVDVAELLERSTERIE